jgi:hypothetical protein
VDICKKKTQKKGLSSSTTREILWGHIYSTAIVSEDRYQFVVQVGFNKTTTADFAVNIVVVVV